MANMNIEGTLCSMFKGMDGFISTKISVSIYGLFVSILSHILKMLYISL